MKGVLRPKSSILPESSLVPDVNLIWPPPNQVTHAVICRQPFFYSRNKQRSAPDGAFEKGTRVVLLVDDGSDFVRVADERGVYVEIPGSSLQKLP